MNDKWECYLCSQQEDFNNPADGYLANYHPLCLKCADQILDDENHPDKFRLTYHSALGELKILKGIPVQFDYLRKN